MSKYGPYKIGSNLLGLDNTKDNDTLYVCDEIIGFRKFESKNDTCYRSIEEVKRTLKFDGILSNNKLFNYQLSKQLQPDFFIDYDLLDYRSELIAFLKNISKKGKFRFSTDYDDEYCYKWIYHIAYNVFILENNSFDLTEEQKEIIQKIHDGEMPSSYITTLKEKIENLQ